MICKDLWDICENKNSFINKRKTEWEREMELEDELIYHDEAQFCVLRTKNQDYGLGKQFIGY